MEFIDIYILEKETPQWFGKLKVYLGDDEYEIEIEDIKFECLDASGIQIGFWDTVKQALLENKDDCSHGVHNVWAEKVWSDIKGFTVRLSKKIIQMAKSNRLGDHELSIMRHYAALC